MTQGVSSAHLDKVREAWPANRFGHSPKNSHFQPTNARFSPSIVRFLISLLPFEQMPHAVIVPAGPGG